jgi:hypothetical protein
MASAAAASVDMRTVPARSLASMAVMACLETPIREPRSAADICNASRIARTQPVRIGANASASTCWSCWSIVQIGKQLLITSGSLTTFSIANDIAKYFAIIPAMFAGVFVGLDRLNVMRLASPESAILSAVIFNALIIIGLIPLALRGVRYRPSSAAQMLRRNLAIYGLGGIISPFIGIKLIDLLVSQIPGIR